MTAVRTLLIRRPLQDFTEEERGALVRTLTRVDALGNLWARGYEIYPLDLSSMFTHNFDYFQREIAFNNGDRVLPKRWFARVHALLDVQVRINSERDIGRPVLIDLPRGELRLRGVIERRAVVIKLRKSELKYIRQRLSEGGKLKLASAWVDDGFLYLALTFERVAEPYEPKAVISIDVNSMGNGISWALIKEGEIVKVAFERPDLGKIERLYNEYVRLGRYLGRMKRLGLSDSPKAKRARRKMKRLASRVHSVIRDFLGKLAHRLVAKALRHQALIVIDEPREESIRGLLEEGLGNGLAKVYLAGLGRFVKLLENQANWYGVPIRHARLYSTICPFDGEKLVEVDHRVMKCPKCGFVAKRDEVPHYWATGCGYENTQVVNDFSEIKTHGPHPPMCTSTIAKSMTSLYSSQA